MNSQYEPHKLGLYIHIPFCKQKCNYCTFFSRSGMEKYILDYFIALQKELESYQKELKKYLITTIYFGGGTPSLVAPQYITMLLKHIKKNFLIEKKAEITIETNPESLTLRKLREYKKAGINRISIGLQAWQDNLLTYLGRKYTHDLFHKKMNLIKKAGFTNINIDCIFGIPGQTIKNWNETLEHILQYRPTHIACYSLHIERNTPFGRSKEKGTFIPIDESLDRKMYWEAIHKLKKNGYKHYEISNFSKKGFECRHNLNFWNYQPYIGIGSGAHSYFQNQRYNNFYDIKKYITYSLSKKSTKKNNEVIDGKKAFSEFMLLKLRLINGFDRKDFQKQFKKDVFEIFKIELKKLVSQNLLQCDRQRIKFTKKGLNLGNSVWMELMKN
jgi:oxygen-independent coproporphyrinogen-3 oxidase